MGSSDPGRDRNSRFHQQCGTFGGHRFPPGAGAAGRGGGAAALAMGGGAAALAIGGGAAGRAIGGGAAGRAMGGGEAGRAIGAAALGGGGAMCGGGAAARDGGSDARSCRIWGRTCDGWAEGLADAAGPELLPPGDPEPPGDKAGGACLSRSPWPMDPVCAGVPCAPGGLGSPASCLPRLSGLTAAGAAAEGASLAFGFVAGVVPETAGGGADGAPLAPGTGSVLARGNPCPCGNALGATLAGVAAGVPCRAAGLIAALCGTGSLPCWISEARCATAGGSAGAADAPPRPAAPGPPDGAAG